MTGAFEVRRVGRGMSAVFRDGERVSGPLTKAGAEDRATRMAWEERGEQRPADRIEVRRFGRGLWAVYRNGRRVSGALVQEAAEDRAARMVAESHEQLRPCISCRREFPSQGRHNRMCDPCRDRAGSSCSDLYSLSAEPLRRLG